MKCCRLPFTLATVLVCAAVSARAEDRPIAFETDVLPIVTAFCTECHNAFDKKGDLDIERFETMDMVVDSMALWQRIAMRVENREMPPKDEPKPSDEERALIAEWAKSLQPGGGCDTIANEESQAWFPGFVMSRRLNRFEYENTLRDLLGVEVSVAESFPADGAGGEGFDNNGDALFLSAIQIEKYLDAADLAIEQALPEPRWKWTAGPSNPRLLPFIPERWIEEEADARTARARLIPVDPGHKVSARDAARSVIAEFAARAWRRPVTDDETDRLLNVFDAAREHGDSYDQSIKLAYKAVLLSPHFVFLAEPEPDAPGEYALGDFPLAARLSYFLWGSMPDGELAAAAREGRLQEDGVLRAQVARMLKDPKARALGDLFAGQWLGITQLGEITKPDADRFPEFDETLAADMREEASRYFTRIVQEDRSLLELIDSDYTVANERLAAIYGLPDVAGGEMRVVPLADDARGGVLGMAAVLTATSHPLRTSPVLRGKWVLEQLLGDRVPPPPPDVPALPEDDQPVHGLSFREQLEAHRTKPECASCHAKMDPIGFGLENFDPIGRWRAELGGAPVDARGELPSGETFSGPVELKAILMKRKDDFARHLSQKMLGYALGRPLTAYDQCVIRDSVAALQRNDYRASALFTEIALSYPFRHRYSGGVKDTD